MSSNAPSETPAEGEHDPQDADCARALSRSELRNQQARRALHPFAEAERPRSLWVAVIVAVILAIATVIGSLTVHDLSRRGGSVPGAVFIAVVLLWMAMGMFNKRYWAVLSFQALLAFQILVTAIALVVASTLYAAVLCLVSILLSGWLFWKLVGIMGRIQAGGENFSGSLR